MEKVLRMEFENEFGTKTSISIPDPKASLTETQIKAAMNTIKGRDRISDKTPVKT